MSNQKIEGNIWKYGFLLVANKRLLAPILGAFYLTIPGVAESEIGVIILISSLAGFLLEIPSGYVSDKVGHKQALVFSRLAMVISTGIFVVADSMFMLILAGILLSAAMAFLSGTGSAFMHETLKALGRDKEYTKIMGRLSAIGFSVPITLAALLPFLVTYGYQLPFLISLVIDTISLVITLTLVVPPVEQMDIDEIKATNFTKVMKEGLRLNYFSVGLFTGILSGILFALGIFRAPYQVWLGVPVIWFGLLHGAGRVLASILLAYSDRLKQYFNFLLLLRFQIISNTALVLGLVVFDNIYLILGILVMLNGLQWGLSKVEEGYQLEIIRHSKFKATLLSVKSQINNLFAAVVSFAVGFSIGHISYQMTYLLVAVLMLVTLVPIYFHISKKMKEGKYNFSD